MHIALQVSIIVAIVIIALTQLYLLFRFILVSRKIAKIQDQSSGDHRRFKKTERVTRPSGIDDVPGGNGDASTPA